MQKKRTVLLEERDLGANVTATLSFAAANFKAICKSLLFISGPFVLLGGIALGFYNPYNYLSAGSALDAFSSVFSWNYVLVIVFSLAIHFATALTVSSFLIIYEESGHEATITPEMVWNKISQRLFDLILAAILGGILMCVAFLLFLLPGIYASIPIQFLLIVMMREQTSVSDALRKCFYLIRNHWWSTFLFLLVMGLLAYAVSFAFQIPNMIIQILKGLSLATDTSNSGSMMNSGTFSFVNVLSSILAMIGSTLMNGLVILGMGFQYYSLLEKKEGAGLLKEIEAIGNRPFAE